MGVSEENSPGGKDAYALSPGGSENLNHGKSNRGATRRAWWLIDQERKPGSATQVFIF